MPVSRPTVSEGEPLPSGAVDRLFEGPGRVRAHCRAIDWARTPLGPVETWPASLRTAVRLVLDGGVPMGVHWGPEAILFFNDAAAAAFAAPPDALGRPLADMLPQRRAAVHDVHARVWRGETVTLGDERVPCDGEGARTFAMSFSPVRDEQGEVAGVLMVAVETTGRVRAESALRESLDQYRMIVEGARDYAILTSDAEGIITGWSPGSEAVYGWSAGEAIGQKLDMTFTPGDRAERVPEAERELARRTGWAPDVRWHQRKDGAHAFIDGITRRLEDDAGNVRGFLKIGQDVTERRRTEEALRSSNERYRTLLENIRDYVIYLLDAEGYITEWTAGAEKLKGYTAEEVLGRHFAMFFTPEDIAAGAPEAELAEAARTGRAERQGWRVRKDGSRFCVDEIATAVHDAAGRVVGFTKISRDLTEQRRAEANAAVVRAEAEREAWRRELAAAEEEERRRIARELHDRLGQHLAALTLGVADARRLLREHRLRDDQLREIETLAQDMTRDARHLALELRPPELDDVGLASALASHVEQWGARFGIEVEVTATGAAATAPMPATVGTALYRIAQEALTNVAKHAQAREVTVSLDRGPDMVRLVVEDDGIGFDARTTNARVRRERRLGLASMRERAALVGGTLEVETSPGRGTSVYVRVPLAYESPSSETEQRSDGPMASANRGEGSDR